ncbi:MAG: hypothetical protein SGCHY_004903 [Lobulomycetales sp.]
MMGFEAKYFFTCLCVYIYATFIALLALVDSFTNSVDKILLYIGRTYRERVLSGTFLDILLMFGWIVSTATIVTLAALTSFYHLCYHKNNDLGDTYGSCSESLIFLSLSVFMNMLCCATLILSLLRACRRWDEGDDDEMWLKHFDLEADRKKSEMGRQV